jgi:hypothetical protein
VGLLRPNDARSSWRRYVTSAAKHWESNTCLFWLHQTLAVQSRFVRLTAVGIFSGNTVGDPLFAPAASRCQLFNSNPLRGLHFESAAPFAERVVGLWLSIRARISFSWAARFLARP